ncbi:MAG: helix-turn-helix transcriptional regulator [Dehalococcoidales bacterium]|nr:helix-turn-helix transcriptional regulator [Dehalococcoidales bacterium]
MKREYIEQLMKGITEPVLLYLINEVPTYGYNLIKELEKRTTGYFKLKGGTIYPALQRLETKGLVKSRRQRTTERQARKYYQITEKGQQFLANRLAEWKDFSMVVSMLMGISNTGKTVSPNTA